MSLAESSNLMLTWMVTYGATAFAIFLFFGAILGMLPSSLMVIAAGAFVRQGVMDPLLTPLLGFLGVVSGDMMVYIMGRYAHDWIVGRFGDRKWMIRASEYFNERGGGGAIYFSRWLVTPIAVPVNLVAGSSHYPFKYFLLYDIAGELTWLLLLGGLGYAFGSAWEQVSQFVTDFSGMLLGFFVLGAGVYLGMNRFKYPLKGKRRLKNKRPSSE